MGRHVYRLEPGRISWLKKGLRDSRGCWSPSPPSNPDLHPNTNLGQANQTFAYMFSINELRVRLIGKNKREREGARRMQSSNEI